MFYDAMICDGVGMAKALEFYTAVCLFGPHWDDPTPQPAPTAARAGKGAAPRAKPKLKKRRGLAFA